MLLRFLFIWSNLFIALNTYRRFALIVQNTQVLIDSGLLLNVSQISNFLYILNVPFKSATLLMPMWNQSFFTILCISNTFLFILKVTNWTKTDLEMYWFVGLLVFAKYLKFSFNSVNFYLFCMEISFYKQSTLLNIISIFRYHSIQNV